MTTNAAKKTAAAKKAAPAKPKPTTTKPTGQFSIMMWTRGYSEAIDNIEKLVAAGTSVEDAIAKARKK